MLIVASIGGLIWWRNRLTPTERELVGQWKHLSRADDGSTLTGLFEFREDRSVYQELNRTNSSESGLFDPLPTGDDTESWYVQGGHLFFVGPDGDLSEGLLKMVDTDHFTVTWQKDWGIPISNAEATQREWTRCIPNNKQKDQSNP